MNITLSEWIQFTRLIGFTKIINVRKNYAIFIMHSITMAYYTQFQFKKKRL